MTEIERRFSRHVPDHCQNEVLDDVRQAFIALVEELDLLLPVGHEKDKAMDRLDEAIYWINGSILRPTKQD